MCMFDPHKTNKPLPKPCDRKNKKQMTLLQRNKMKDTTYISTHEKIGKDTKGNIKQVIQSLISRLSIHNREFLCSIHFNLFLKKGIYLKKGQLTSLIPLCLLTRRKNLRWYEGSTETKSFRRKEAQIT